MKDDKARHFAEPALSVEPDFLELFLGAVFDFQAVHPDENCGRPPSEAS
jgi:hypothetical protein